jgi:hypothetical protein
MRVELLRRLRMPVLLMTMGALAMAGQAEDLTLDAARPRVTVVVKAERALKESAWAALESALVRDLEAASGPAGPTVELVRADQVEPGREVQTVVTVTLHGDCTLRPGPPVVVSGALGWVPRTHGRIEPFVHVECERIAQMLAPRALALRQEARETVMADAVARVVEHEWLHLMTQSAAHSGRGVMQAQFTVMDLLDEAENLGMARGR